MLRQGISPTPKLPDKKKKTFKTNEKFDQLWQALKNDTVEMADFSNGGSLYISIINNRIDG